MARTTAVTENGRNIYVGDGAVRQQGPKKLYTCNACGREVVWLESKRTGKVYLASVFRGEVVRYYVSRPHECKPRELPPIPNPKDEEYRVANNAWINKLITRDQYLQLIDHIDAKYAPKAAQTDESGLADEIRDWATGNRRNGWGSDCPCGNSLLPCTLTDTGVHPI